MSHYGSWHEEKQSAWLYRHLAARERDERRNRLFASLADAAESQARLWEGKMVRAGEGVPPPFRPTWRARIVERLLRLLGPRPLRPALAALKIRGLSVYGGTPSLAEGHPMPRSAAEVGRRHRGIGRGGNLRAAVFGVNDGLVSNTSLIMGVAGAADEPEVVLIAGVAGLLAGALSMAAGEYVSMRSQRELFEYQIGLERQELDTYPEEEAEELALIYHARGASLARARAMADDILANREYALDALAREELGLNPEELGSPWGAASSSFAAFTVGALVPLAPFLFSAGSTAVLWAALAAACGLFAVGAILSLFTGRGALFSGARMLTIGGGAGVVTYLIGTLLGAGGIG